jgi:hypothetical protein
VVVRNDTFKVCSLKSRNSTVSLLELFFPYVAFLFGFMCISVYTNFVKPKRTRSIRVYNPDNLNMAIQDVKSGKMSFRQASRVYGVPLSTIHLRIRGRATVKTATPVFNIQDFS